MLLRERLFPEEGKLHGEDACELSGKMRTGSGH